MNFYARSNEMKLQSFNHILVPEYTKLLKYAVKSGYNVAEWI